MGEAFVEEFREQGKNVLVHCHAGVNRSTTLCVAYLMHRHRMPLLDIVRSVVRKRGMVLSNAVFVEQLVRLARKLGCSGFDLAELFAYAHMRVCMCARVCACGFLCFELEKK